MELQTLELPYQSYSQYLKRHYGGRIQKITVDAGFTCPNRDGSKGVGGCTYCNNESFAPVHLKKKSITEQVQHGITLSQRRYKKSRAYFVYFQAYSNTYAPLPKLRELYEEALGAHPEVRGLCIGTRPDCIDAEKLDYLQELVEKHGHDIIMEYGLETISDETYLAINRGHTFQEFLDAVHLTAGRGIQTCAHLMLGLPGDTREQWVETAKILSTLPVDFLKIHQLHIDRYTVLGNQYLKNPFPVMDVYQYVEAVIEFLEHLSPRIIIQRLFSEVPPHLELSPPWEIPYSQFNDYLTAVMRERQTFQGKKCPPSASV